MHDEEQKTAEERKEIEKERLDLEKKEERDLQNIKEEVQGEEEIIET